MTNLLTAVTTTMYTNEQAENGVRIAIALLSVAIFVAIVILVVKARKKSN
jgi:hypothetical protein